MGLGEKYKHVYKIDDIHRRIVRVKEDGTEDGYTKHPIPPKHEFDIENQNLYYENRELKEEQNGGFYDLQFKRQILRIRPLERVIDFLEYQYKHTKQPQAFLARLITGGVIGQNFGISHPDRHKLIVDWVHEKQKEDKSMATDTKEDKVPLTERLLIIRYLEEHSLFPKYNTAKGETKKQYEYFISILLSEKPDTVKRGFQRVYKILKGLDITKENQAERIRQLQAVRKYFEGIGQTEIVGKIDKLLTKTNMPLK